MIEWLALPATGSAPVGPDVWITKLTEAGYQATLERAGPDDQWIEIVALKLRGYLVSDGPNLEAIHFEYHGPNISSPLPMIESLVTSLAWELHPYDADDEE